MAKEFITADDLGYLCSIMLNALGYDVEVTQRTEILPCPYCGGADAFIEDQDYVRCGNESCQMIGPIEDPDALKWNSLLRG